MMEFDDYIKDLHDSATANVEIATNTSDEVEKIKALRRAFDFELKAVNLLLERKLTDLNFIIMIKSAAILAQKIQYYRNSNSLIKTALEYSEKYEDISKELLEIRKNNEKLQKRPTHNYTILKKYTVEEVIKMITEASLNRHKFVVDGEFKFKIKRARILKKIGYKCVECGVTGTFFALGKDKGGSMHLDLYGNDLNGKVIMITIDHILPKSKGGKDAMINYQPMCKICNELKGNKI